MGHSIPIKQNQRKPHQRNHRNPTMRRATCIALALLVVVAVCSADPYGSRNRDCPIRNKNVKKGLVRPAECRALKGSWVGSWQQCGALCTRSRDCNAWTFKSQWCQPYKNAQRKCGFVSAKGAGYTAGYSGCEA